MELICSRSQRYIIKLYSHLYRNAIANYQYYVTVIMIYYQKMVSISGIILSIKYNFKQSPINYETIIK